MFRHVSLRLFSVVVFVVLGVSGALPRVALAQSAGTPPAADTRTASPDVVLLVNGGLVRGTIVEAIPGERVSITLSTGETRTFTGAQVYWAGPASQAPTGAAAPPPGYEAAAPPPPLPPPPPQPRYTQQPPDAQARGVGARLYIIGTEPDLTLHIQSAEATASYTNPGLYNRSVRAFQFDRVCTAPCTGTLGAGQYLFAVSSGTGTPIAVERPTTVAGEIDLRLRYDRRTALNAGIITASIAGIVVGLGLAFASFKGGGEGLDVPLFVVGCIFAIGSPFGFMALPGPRAYVDTRRHR